MSANAGIGNPTNSPFGCSTLSEITLNLASLNIPHITIKKHTNILMYRIWVVNVVEYRNIPGAIPNEMISHNESIFLPKSESSIRFNLRAIHPSTESNITAKTIN